VYNQLPLGWQVADVKGDFNGDGRADILTRNSDGTLSMWLMDGARIAQGAVIYDHLPLTWQVVDAHDDFNGDGKSDILTRSTSDGTLSLWTMDGTHIVQGAVLSGQVGTDWGVIVT